jgi:hypothetical protein
MKIKYAIHYDSEVFVRNDAALFGTIYAGNRKLLDQLELRAALPQVVKTDVEREADYLNAMRKHIQGTVFEKSAAVDELGVARKLMQWRDALVMAGWDGAYDGDKSQKLMVLAAIERDFHSKGEPDRWREIAKAYQKTAILQDTTIEIECPWDELPRLVQMTLEGIEKNGGQVKRMDSPYPESIDIEKVRVVEFDDLNDAYEWIAQAKTLADNVLVVNRDNMRLNHTLYTLDKARTAATLYDSNPQVLQLFKLGMSIFSRPLNVQNVVSYLQLPLSPIPASLRRELAKLLLNEGGFGEKKVRGDGKERNEWDEKIAKYEFLNKEGKTSPQVKAQKMVFITPICKDYKDGISKEELNDYVDNLMKWINGFGADEELKDELRAQLHELRALFNSLSISLQTMPETLQYKDIEMLVQSIYRPMNYSVQQTEKGAMKVVNDILEMAQPADEVIWLDCQEEDRETDHYDFLSHDEKEYLKDNGVVVPNFRKHLQNLRGERLRKINAVNGWVTLVKSAYDGTTRLGEHSLIAEVRQCYQTIASGTKKDLPVVSKDGIFDAVAVETKSQPVERFEPSMAYELGALNIPDRKESNTSIDTLINYPFDYVMQYVAKLYQPSEDQVNNTFVTQGLVAHYFFEHIIKDADGNLESIRQKVSNEFELCLDEAIDATGLILRLPENASELKNFTRHLKESILALTDIMQRLRLTPVGCEINLPEDDGKLELSIIGDFGARIDLLLSDINGDMVVFDFKWSYSGKYEKKLADNISIQLDLYRSAVAATYKDKNVRGVGYYLMPRKQLLTCDFDEIEGCKLVKHIECADTGDLSQKIKNSFSYRMEELKSGHIEEAEEVDIKDNQDCYYANQEQMELCPLVVTEKTTGRGNNKQLLSVKKDSNGVFRLSKKPRYDNEDLEPSEKATKNAILKGRLK